MSARLSDDELLRRRERLFNGLTLFFGAAVLPTAFCAGGYLFLVGEVWAARRCSAIADECRDARQLLGGQAEDCQAST